MKKLTKILAVLMAMGLSVSAFVIRAYEILPSAARRMLSAI